MINWNNPYEGLDDIWLKGNLHTHTGECSPCGQVPLNRVLELYEENGYDFLAISDHQHCTQVTLPTEMLLIPGIEWNARTNDQEIQTVNYEDHLGLYSLDPAILQKTPSYLTAAETLRSLQGTESLRIINHPNWLVPHHYTEEELFSLYPLAQGMEIYNAVIERHPGSADATMKWDRLLTDKGPILGFASDDSHLEADIARAWLMVNVQKPDLSNLFSSIFAGRFYCSTGVIIHDIGVDGDILYCLTDKDVAIDVIGENGRLLASHDREIRFDITSTTSSYIRFALYGSGKQKAWSQPFFTSTSL